MPASASERLCRGKPPGASCKMLCTIPYGADGRLCPLPLPNNLTGTSCPVPAARCFAQFFGFRAGCARCPVPCTVPMGSKTAFLPRLGRKAVSRYHLNSVPAHAHRAHACPDPCNGGRPADLLSLDAVQPAARRRPNHASRRNLAPPFPRLALPVAFSSSSPEICATILARSHGDVKRFSGEK